MYTRILIFAALFFSNTGNGQDMDYVRKSIATLSSPGFGGRGYVGNSREKAARFLYRNFTELGLKSFAADGNYYQQYFFDVNTFPNRVSLKVGKKELRPGIDFLVDAASSSFQTSGKTKMERINLDRITDSLDWQKQKSRIKESDVLQLHHVDDFCKRMNLHPKSFVAQLPRACYIIPQAKKLIWTVVTDTVAATVFYVADTSLPKGKKVVIDVQHKMLKSALSKNIIGYIPGTVFPDSFLVFTAHYDHLGKMGTRTLFPGANDNASGTAFNLALAKYFAVHPQKYSVVFIAFSGEEAGLLGSGKFVADPVFPLSKIKFLVNIDLMGDATDGITVVNATEQKRAFDLLQKINAGKKYLPKIVSRDNAPNSDHYPFTQAKVPAIFIYANGGKGHYHDVFDKAKELSMNNIPKVFLLLTDFMNLTCQGE